MTIKNIQALRALAANGVVLSHLYVTELKYGHGFVILPVTTQLATCGVDLFFVISGFIMAIVAYDVSWRRFLFDRTTRIFPPYWFYTTVILIVSILFPSIVNSSYPHPPSLLRSYLLIPDTVTPLLAVGWTLIHEMYFYLCFALIIFLTSIFRFRLPLWLFIWAALIVVSNSLAQAYEISTPIIAVITHPLTLEFIMGAVVGCIIRREITDFGVPVMAAGIVGLIAVFLLSDKPDIVNIRNLQNVILLGIPCALIVYGAVAIELNNVVTAPNLLIALGNASYSTYLSHVLVLSAIGRVFAAIPQHNIYLETVFVIVCIASANIAGLLSYRFIERRPQAWLRKLWVPKKFRSFSAQTN